MANELKTAIRDCIHNIDANKRYVRPEEVADYFGLQIEDILVVALAAGARYQLPRTTLIHTENVYVVGGISPFFDYQTQLVKLEDYLEKKMIIGIKLFTGHEMFYLTDNRISEVYDLAIRYDVPVLFHSGWDNSRYSAASVVAKVAEEYPELKLVCCHCFYPNICDCQELIQYSNAYFDISSIADDLTILGEVESEIKKLIHMIPTRVLFVSDYLGCNQMHHIELVRSLGLDKRTEELVFEKNATRLYSLK